MATTPAISNAPIPAPISQRLRRLRGKITIWFLIDGLSKLLLAVVVLIGLDLLVDWTFHMDRAQRAVMLVLCLGCLGYVAYRWLLRPLSYHLSDDALCLRVERHYNELGESLISAVQFARMGHIDAQRVSPAMVRATIDQGTEAAGHVEFGNVLRSDRFVLNSAVLVSMVAVLGLVGVGVAQSETLNVWFDRNVLVGDAQWPQDYFFRVHGLDGGKLRIPRGDTWPLAVSVVLNEERGDVTAPSEVSVEIRSASDDRSERMEKGAGQLDFRLELPKVVRPFRFRLRGGKVRSAWYEAVLVDRPDVEDLELAVTPPDYTGGQAEPLPAGRGPYYLLSGSALSIRGRASKKLSGAVLSVGDVRQPMKISGEDRFAFDLAPDALAEGTYSIDVFDTESMLLPGRDEPGPLGSKRPTRFTLRIKPDRAPQIDVRLSGISSMVVPGATLPCEVRARDDYSVTAVRLTYEWSNDASDAGPTSGATPMELREQVPADQVRFDYNFELGPLEIPPGSGLRFRFEGDDNDTVSGPKVGQSTEFLLRVVSPSDLLDELLRREKEQRQEFQRLRDEQDKIATECEAMLARLRNEGNLPETDRVELMKLEKRQRLLGANMLGISKRLADIIAELKNNHLDEDGTREERLQGQIIDPMVELSEQAIPAAALKLDDTRRAETTEARHAALEQAVERQRAIITEMDAILVAMVQAEGYQEIVNKIFEIEKSQEEVFNQTEKERLQKVVPLPEKKSEPEEKKSEPEQEKPGPEQKPNAEDSAGRAEVKSKAEVKSADKPSEAKDNNETGNEDTDNEKQG